MKTSPKTTREVTNLKETHSKYVVFIDRINEQCHLQSDFEVG